MGNFCHALLGGDRGQLETKTSLGSVDTCVYHAHSEYGLSNGFCKRSVSHTKGTCVVYQRAFPGGH